MCSSKGTSEMELRASRRPHCFLAWTLTVDRQPLPGLTLRFLLITTTKATASNAEYRLLNITICTKNHRNGLAPIAIPFTLQHIRATRYFGPIIPVWHKLTDTFQNATSKSTQIGAMKIFGIIGHYQGVFGPRDLSPELYKSYQTLILGT
ncbi:uncharacterized protein CLUP02_16625 [Colletotrichum lupini]|uniref:Uncharacterized protein n=1 Tax=Colletotrichum lupini TaxID=145971 RepID=A0A9Q8TAH5_9PEZI|nr:uncharacterized protein CLUP02_16625 [Colletotrichum lupini]UQC91091.1 hypothetical protein CLUP02_16625 [Colletotrichum lupini]